jgi:hypothetical protein
MYIKLLAKSFFIRPIRIKLIDLRKFECKIMHQMTDTLNDAEVQQYVAFLKVYSNYIFKNDTIKTHVSHFSK